MEMDFLVLIWEVNFLKPGHSKIMSHLKLMFCMMSEIPLCSVWKWDHEKACSCYCLRKKPKIRILKLNILIIPHFDSAVVTNGSSQMWAV